MNWAPNGFEWVRNTDGLPPEFYPQLFTASANRGVAVVQGRFAVNESDGTVDGIADADSANGSGATIKGLIVGVYDTTGQKLKDIPYVPTTAACMVQLQKVRKGDIFRAVLDGTATSNTVGSLGIAIGTPTNTSSDDSFHPGPECIDKLDASTYDATVTQLMFQIVGLDPDIRNVENASTAKVLEVKVNDAWRTD